MIDKEYMESDSLSTNNMSHRTDDRSLMASSSENSILDPRIIPNSRMENNFEDKNEQEPPQNKKAQNNSQALEQSHSAENKFEKNRKQRDLFEELKQESLNESSLSSTSNDMYSSPAEGGDHLPFNCKSDNKPLKKYDSPASISPVTFEKSHSNDSGKNIYVTSNDIGSKNDLINLSPDEPHSNSDDLICGMKKESGQSDNLLLETQAATIVNPVHNTVGNFLHDSENQGRELNNTVESLTLSPQILEDFENLESHTEEEVDSVIYDKSTDSVCSNKIFGRNESLTVFSDTDGDAVNEEEVLPPNEEVMMVGDRRKSLSRQLSVDVGRATGPNILEQPETEVEDEYPQSVSSMDGFTLSRSSSQDSVLSERLSQYSQREITRKRRHALCRIFSFLDTTSLIQVALVCREWKKISRHPSLWKHVYLKNQKCSLEFLLNISKWCTSMETLHLEGLKTREKKEFETEEDYNKRTRAVLEPGLEKLLQVSESTLKTATIIHCENIITDKGLWLVSCYSRVVRKVTYICNTDLPGADVIWALGAGCRDISYLNITLTDPSAAVGVKFNNKCLQVISQFCQDLQTLCICGTEIDMNGLVLIAKSCQRLSKLEIHYGITVTEDTMVAVCRLGLHNLQQIYFNFTPVEAKAILQLYKSSKHLQKIHISLDISCFDLKGEYKEEDKMKKYADMVKNLKELQKKPGVGNILKLSCGEVFINTEKKFFGLF
ncbi:FBXO41 [Mytilus edulis]|uniref:FBXO41 n=1 Tax=Mytilus edulis TaxID=6550 RepID=A0A8S3Q993_MYTED|nr:FBXO41 [Mytilus edulis]